MAVVEKLFNQFLDSKSPEFIHMDPSVVRVCQERFKIGMEKGDLPTDLLDGLQSIVKERLVSLLNEYFASKEFYTACRKHSGFLWRVIKLSRLSFVVCSELLEKVFGPRIDMCNRGDLACVPNFSQQNYERFREMYRRYNEHLLRLKGNLHIIAYLTKETCVRESMRESHASSRPIGQPGVAGLEGNARKNY